MISILVITFYIFLKLTTAKPMPEQDGFFNNNIINEL